VLTAALAAATQHGPLRRPEFTRTAVIPAEENEMTYRLLPEEPVQDGVRRVALEQIDAALSEIQDRDLPTEKTVHQVRKRCKKLRGLLRLVRPALGDTYARENAAYRDLASSLSGARDAAVMLEAHQALLQDEGTDLERKTFASVGRALEDAVYSGATGHDVEARLAGFEAAVREARDRAEGWTLDEDGFDAVSGGLRKTYSRGRDAFADASADGTPESYHEWRKRVKYHTYHLRLLRGLWPAVIEPWRQEGETLGKLLGTTHDLDVLRETIEKDPERYGTDEERALYFQLLDREREKLVAAAWPLGVRLFAEKPKAYSKRMERYWEAGTLGGDD
jgi:hypothetical protein